MKVKEGMLAKYDILKKEKVVCMNSWEELKVEWN